MADFTRIPNKFAISGMDLHHPPDLLPLGKCALLFNLEPDTLNGALSMRPPIVPLLSTPVTIPPQPVHSIVRLNDSVPEAVLNPFARFVGNDTLLSRNGDPLDSGFSGNPIAFVPYRPPQSPESYLYVYDSLKQRRYKTSGMGQNIGVQAPSVEPSLSRIKPLYDIVDNATATWSVFGSPVGGGVSTPGTVVRVTASTTILEIVYDSGTTGMACISPTNSGASYAWMTPGSMVILDSEPVVLEQVFAGSYSTTVAAIQYDAGSTGVCTIVPTIPLPGLARNMLLNLHSGTYVRVTSVTEGPDGSYSFRVNTGGTTIAVGQTIVGPPSFRAWTTINHAATAPITGNSINATYTPTATGGAMSGIIEATPGVTDLSYAGTRPLQNEDYMHVSVAVDQPAYVTEIHILLDVDATTNDFAHNYYYYVLRQGDFQLSSVGGTTTLQDQLSAISNTIAGQLIDEEFVDAGASQPGYPVPENIASSTPATAQLSLGQLQWLESMFKLSDLTRVGNDQTRTLANVVSIGIQVYTSGGVVNLYVGGWWAGGGYGPDCNFNSYGNQAPPIQWRYRYRNSLTGARSTVSPETRNGEILRRQGINITVSSSSDQQVDTIDFERRGGTNPDWHYVASLPQGVSTTTFLDNVTENAAQAGDPLEVTCYQPWPVTDIPHNGTALVTGTSVVWQSGDQFNVRWLRGTEIIIGGNTYSLFAPPSSATFCQLAQCVPPPSGVYPFQIPEATIEGNPLYGAWLDEGSNRVLSVGDPLNPGLLYFSNNDNPDGASDSGYIEVTSPSEPLLNGCYAEGSNWVFTASGIFRVDPTPGAINPYAAFRVSGVEGLSAPWGFNVISKLLYYWGPDGIYEYGFGNESKNITRDDLFPLFPNQGQAGQPGTPGVPVSISGQTIYPPNYALPTLLRIGYSENFVYATYQNSIGAIEALVYSLAAQGWRKDSYNPAATLFVLETGVPNPVLMVGGSDGNLYQPSATATQDAGGPINWTALPKVLDAGDSRAVKQWGDSMLDSSGTINVQVIWDNLLMYGASAVVGLNTNRSHTLVDLFSPPDTNDTPLIHYNVTVLLTGQGPVYLYEWQPSFIPLPEITTSRVTGWDGSGGLHYKFVQGIRLHFNTFGQNKRIEVQYDGYQIGTSLTVSADGQQTIPYAFVTPFKAHMMRLVPLDDVPWEVWPDSEWIFEPEPEPANYWISQPTSLGQSGYLHCRELWPAWAGSGIVSVIVDGGTPVTLANLTVSASPVKSYFPCPPLKGKYWQLTATGTGLQLYERDIEFLVKSWGSTGPYIRVRPFGDLSGGGGQTGARIKTAKRPPIALNPSIPLVIQRAIRSVSDYAFGANDKADAATAGLATKVSKDEQGLLEVSQFASKQLSAGGQYPINLTGLNGRAQQSQFSYVPPVQNLPLRPNSLTSDGQLVWYQNQLYRFNKIGGSPTSLVQPGQWQSVSGIFLTGPRSHRQNHTLFPQYDPANLGVGAAFFETDSELIYVVLPDPYVTGNPNQWFYASGIALMYWPYRNAPGSQWPGTGVTASWDYTDLYAKLWVSDQAPGSDSLNGKLDYVVLFATGTPGPTGVYDSFYQSGIYINTTANTPGTVPSTPSSPLSTTFDVGFLNYAGNKGHTWQWTGLSGWTWAPEDSGAGQAVAGPVAPNPGTGWWEMIPVAGGSISVSSESGATTPFTYAAYTSFNTLNPGWFFWARL